MNQGSKLEYAMNLWACDECSNIETESHIMWCPSYTMLSEGLNIESDTVVVRYFQTVMKHR